MEMIQRNSNCDLRMMTTLLNGDKNMFRVYLLLAISLFIGLAPVSAELVSVDTAGQVAVNSMNKNIRIKGIKALKKQMEGDSKAQLQLQGISTLSAENIAEAYIQSYEEIPVYYIFNFEPEGWAIIAADDVAYPTIAYSDTGKYHVDASSQSPSHAAWMDNVAAEIASAVTKNLNPLPDAKEAWAQLNVTSADFATADIGTMAAAVVVSPLLDTQWGQGGGAGDCVIFEDDPE